MLYNEHDKVVESVLQYLVNHHHGYMRDLEKLNEQKIISELISIGILKTGFAPDGETYSITKFGIQYCNTINIVHRSAIHMLFNKIRLSL